MYNFEIVKLITKKALKKAPVGRAKGHNAFVKKALMAVQYAIKAVSVNGSEDGEESDTDSLAGPDFDWDNLKDSI